MGCGASKSSPVKDNWTDDPLIDSISVQDFDHGYPRPSPPPDKKNDIYRSKDYDSIDARVKQQSAQINTSTYATLINTLTSGCKTDLQKLRSIFVWLYLQDIHESFYSRVTDPHTPRGYMKLIKTQNGSYATFFALLCRAAGIPCNVIRGVGKGDKYEVGQQDVSNMESAWNAVYVAGGWRFVHPLWSFFQEKQTYDNGVRPPPGSKRTSIQEFFWLTDPDRLICFCKPHADEWQLLKAKCDQNKFLKIPQFTEEYFDCGLMLPKKYNGINHVDGCAFVLDFEHDNYEEATADTQVECEAAAPSDTMLRDVNMKDYVAISRSPRTKTLAFRFPVRGWYKIDVFGGLDSRKPKLVRLRVECKSPERNPEPFPLHPREGFGILPVASHFGISDPIPDTGIVQVRPKQEKQFSFTSSQKLDVQATLTHIKHDPDSFQDFITTRSTNNELQVRVIVPDKAHLEFGLQIAVRQENERGNFTVVANYLLVDENWGKKVAAVSPTKEVATVSPPKSKEEPVREELIAATNEDNIERLEKAIGNFEHHGLVDNGDLTRAKDKLVQLHLENLRKTTSERKLEELEHAIDLAHKSHVAEDLKDSKELAEAEMTRQQLARLKLYLHKVLALNKSTIAEMHSYPRPRPLVHQVMKATFRILGEPNSKLQSWQYVQSSMRQLGRNSMLARMKNCDIVHLKQRQVDDAEYYLDETNLRSVRMCSAGAGTFYVWSNNMISEYNGQSDKDYPATSKTTTNTKNEIAKQKKDNVNRSYTPSQIESPRNQMKSR